MVPDNIKVSAMNVEVKDIYDKFRQIIDLPFSQSESSQ